MIFGRAGRPQFDSRGYVYALAHEDDVRQPPLRFGQRDLAALKRGFEPDYSEVFLHYGAERYVGFRSGRRCSAALLKRAKALLKKKDVRLEDVYQLGLKKNKKKST